MLTVDIGNTKTELGLWQGRALVGTARAPTAEHRDWAAWATRVVVDSGGGVIEGIATASVVPTAVARWADVAHRMHTRIRVFEGTNMPGIVVGLAHPEAVGPDRLVNVLGALEWSPGPLISVDLGTATTFDVLDENGTFIGGAIAPGAGTALDALVSRTARLPAVPLEAPARAIGRDTLSAMQSGAVFGYVGLVEGLVARIRAELGVHAYCVATGGLADRFAPLCASFDKVDLALTSRGLRRAWELSQ